MVFGSAASDHPGNPSGEETVAVVGRPCAPLGGHPGSLFGLAAMDFDARVGDHPNHRGGLLDDHFGGCPSFDGTDSSEVLANAVRGLLDCFYELEVIGFFEGFVNVVGGLRSLSALETGFFSVANATSIRWVFALAEWDCAPCVKVKGSFFLKSSASDLQVTN